MGIADRDYYREDGRWHNPFARAQVTVFLAITYVVLFVAQLATQPVRGAGKADIQTLTTALEMDVDRVSDGEVWRVVTYALVHPDPEHNVLAALFTVVILLWIGRQIEDLYGNREYLAQFFCTCLLGGLAYAAAGLIFRHELGAFRGPTPALVSLFVLYVMHFPGRTVNVFYVLPVPIWLVGILLAVLRVTAMEHDPGNAGLIAAHVATGCFAFVYHRFSLRVLNWLPTPGRGSRRPIRSKSKLRLFQEQPEPQPEPAAASVGGGVSGPSGSDGGGLDEHLEAKLDEVLEKVNKLGKASLTESEQQVLMRASEIYKKRRQST